MDRELLLLALLCLVPGPLAIGVGFLRFPLQRTSSSSIFACRLEGRTWRALWYPLLPAILSFAAILGWVSREPANAEALPALVIIAGVPSAMLLLRVILFAARTARYKATNKATGTVGILRPRILIADDLRDILDAHALLAVVAHERAHSRHRNPLRLWLARIVTELQGRSRAAVERYDEWRHAVELARDEEARRSGIRGEDLAGAVLEATKLAAVPSPSLVRLLSSDRLQERIDALLRPLPPLDVLLPWRSSLRPIAVTTLLVGCAAAGSAWGELLVRRFCRG